MRPLPDTKVTLSACRMAPVRLLCQVCSVTYRLRDHVDKATWAPTNSLHKPSSFYHPELESVSKHFKQQQQRWGHG